MRKIIHIDMDCFYAAIEMRDNPHWQNIPLAVGGAPDQRGVVCTANYIARKFGVRSAMASAYAKKLCPNLIIVEPNFEKYKAASKIIRQIFLEYTDLIEPLSLDEAYLDVSNSKQCQGSATYIATEIRQKIFEKTQLTASAGIAANKFLAKIASDWNKPNGQWVITPKEVDAFIVNLPVSKIYGVGKVTAKKLHDIGITTCAQLQQVPLSQLTELFGVFGARLYELARGQDERPVILSRQRKSLSVEETFAKDISGLESCLKMLPNLIARLQKRGQDTLKDNIKNQFVKLKFHDFTVTTAERLSKQLTLDIYENLCKDAYLRHQKPVRLIGVGVRFC